MATRWSSTEVSRFVANDITLRTGVWYQDRPVTLSFPDAWDVVTYWPDTPAPLTDEEIRRQFDNPVGQPPLKELARGCRRPVIVVDDLSRPTPVSRVMPFLLGQLREAGVEAESVRVLVATGTHGHQDRTALTNKLGKAAAETCQLVIHDDTRKCRSIGKTSFGTPVYPNHELVDSDLVLGIGGIYPQHSTGFGGGGKLALGVMERRTIRHLHFRHRAIGGTYNIDNDFRRDVTEIARMIGLRTIVTVHIDANLQVVNVTCGDHESYYRDAAHFSRTRYDAPPPEDADVVVANGYPSDISYTFMRKGMKPVRCAPRGATRLVVASNHEGVGKHGLFQQGLGARLQAYRNLYNRVRVMDRRTITQKLLKHARIATSTPRTPATIPVRTSEQSGPLLLFRPAGDHTPMPPLEGVEVMTDWGSVISRISREHAGKSRIRVRIYPCGSLQCIDALETSDGAGHD
jgi:nickel-dependent lactate racemase